MAPLTSSDLTDLSPPPGASDAPHGAGVVNAALAVAPIPMAVVGPDGNIVGVNREIEILTGRDDLLGKFAGELVHPLDLLRHQDDWNDLLSVPGGRVTMNVRARAASGSVPVSVHAATVSSENSAAHPVAGLVVFLQPRASMNHKSSGDTAHAPEPATLTGLVLRERIEQALESGGLVGVLVVEINRLDRLTADFGPQGAGDLQTLLGNRLAAHFGADTVGRIGNGRYGVLRRDIRDARHLMVLAEQAHEVAVAPLRLGSSSHHLSLTVGAAESRSVPGGAEAILDAAVVGVSQARTMGRRLALAGTIDGDELAHAVEIEGNVARAIRGDGLTVVYQPVLNTADETVAVEAFVRMKDRSLPAMEIISAAERANLIIELGQRVVHQSLDELVTMDQGVGRTLSMSVNLTGDQLRDPGMGLALLEVMRDKGVDASRLGVEVTEEAAMEDVASSIKAMDLLRSAGAKVILDDFGLGYASLAYLRDLPLDQVKIDREFIARAAATDAAKQVLAGMVSMCKSLDLEVVGEGIETPRQREVALEVGCDYWQGYLFAKPLEVDDLDWTSLAT